MSRVIYNILKFNMAFLNTFCTNAWCLYAQTEKGAHNGRPL